MSDDILGGIVDIDISKLEKSELIMLGQKTALEKYVNGFRAQASELQHDGVANVLREVADIMDVELQHITVLLTQAAIRTKAGSMQVVHKKGRH
jgi:hypothetical protein